MCVHKGAVSMHINELYMHFKSVRINYNECDI